MFEIYSTMIMKLFNNSLLHCAIVVGALLATPLEGAATTGPDQRWIQGAPMTIPVLNSLLISHTTKNQPTHSNKNI